MTTPASEAIERFLELFNRGEYWESHEALEGLWRESDSDFLQGLILYASAFVHVRRGNRHGIAAQLEKAARKLAPFRPSYLGFDVDEIVTHIEQCRSIVAAHPDARPKDWLQLVPVPRLDVQSSLLAGDEPELSMS